MKEEDTVSNSRRDFLRVFGAGLAGITIVGFAAPMFEGCSSGTSADTTDSADAGKTITVDVSSLAADDMAIHAATPSKKEILVVRKSAGVFVSVLLVCKHMGCTYPSIDLSGQKIACSCHGSQYSIFGHVTQGPATTDLTTFTTTFDSASNKVTVKF
ncbi:MAG: Rieske 2Fe-2S domain-containing protein [Bacteroidota bacterium]|nr:Rieske 2Fe-2S domain-containing protein [Bacteroidota bacterium]MDP4230229.1 Rieske 2Fe-2S domain-containing protein [Bacteroidota bacterium]MDP4236501.1 Rieske 2Fe-2S domain-containing protein [Bacteroidota bacterium]